MNAFANKKLIRFINNRICSSAKHAIDLNPPDAEKMRLVQHVPSPDVPKFYLNYPSFTSLIQALETM